MIDFKKSRFKSTLLFYINPIWKRGVGNSSGWNNNLSDGLSYHYNANNEYLNVRLFSASIIENIVKSRSSYPYY